MTEVVLRRYGLPTLPTHPVLKILSIGDDFPSDIHRLRIKNLLPPNPVPLSIVANRFQREMVAHMKWKECGRS